MIDGDWNRTEEGQSCYRTSDSNLGAAGEEMPRVVFAMELVPVKRVEILTRDVGDPEPFGEYTFKIHIKVLLSYKF